MAETPMTEAGRRRSAREFPGVGTVEHLYDLGTEPVTVTHLDTSIAHKLGEWRSTIICGNDTTSSCLDVAVLSALYAGP